MQGPKNEKHSHAVGHSPFRIPRVEVAGRNDLLR